MAKTTRTIEQQRAGHAARAVAKAKAEFKDTFKDLSQLTQKLPGMVVGNGLGATLAFLRSKKDKQHKAAYAILADWLLDRAENIPWEQKGKQPDLLLTLTEQSSFVYRAAQQEALGYLSWLKRLAKAEAKD